MTPKSVHLFIALLGSAYSNDQTNLKDDIEIKLKSTSSSSIECSLLASDLSRCRRSVEVPDRPEVSRGQGRGDAQDYTAEGQTCQLLLLIDRRLQFLSVEGPLQ